MSITTNSDSFELNIQSCLKMMSIMKQFNEETMKLRLEIAEMQIKVLSLYEAPCLEMLQRLVQIPESFQTNVLTEDYQADMQVDNNNS